MLLAIAACTNKPVAAVENNEESSEEINYFPAIDRYLADSIGSQYTKGEHCVPIHSIVRVDERKGLKWIHKATFQGYQPAIDYCKEHNLKWY